MKGLLVTVWMLNMILVNTQKYNRRPRGESLHCLREYINNYVQIVDRIMDVTGDSGEISDGNEEWVIEKCQRT